MSTNANNQGGDQEEDEIKSSHRATEKKRRQLIKDTINILRELVPESGSGCDRKTKAKILLDTVDFIKQLQNNVQILQHEVLTAETNTASLFNTNSRLLEQIHTVQQENEKLRNLTSSVLASTYQCCVSCAICV